MCSLVKIFSSFWNYTLLDSRKTKRKIYNIDKRRLYTVNWRQNPLFSSLFHIGNTEDCRNSWKIKAYSEDILDTFGQLIGSSIAVIPSLRPHKKATVISCTVKYYTHKQVLTDLKFPTIKPTVGLPFKETPTENSHLFRYPLASGDSNIPSNLQGRPPTQCKLQTVFWNMWKRVLKAYFESDANAT